MIKKMIISLLSTVIIVTSLNITTSNRNSANAFMDGFYYSCSIYIESIERTRDYIEQELVPDYYLNLNYAKMYPEFRDRFVDLADRKQQLIMDYLANLYSDIEALPYCKGVEELPDEALVELLQSIYELLTNPNLQNVFTTEFGSYAFKYKQLDYYKRVFSFLVIVDKMEEEFKNNERDIDLLHKVFGNNPNDLELAYITISSVIDSSFSTLTDLMTFRQISINESEADYVTAVLWMDRVNMIYDFLKEETVSNDQVSKPNKSIFTEKLKKFGSGNLKNSVFRGVVTEAINVQLGNNIPASEYEFLTDFVSNFAAILTVDTRLGLALVYAELNADLMAHVNKNLSLVWDSADVAYNEFMNEQQTQKIQFANEIHHTASNLMEAKLNTKYTSNEFSNVYINEIDNLEMKLQKIYNTKPNSDIKIYMDGYLLKSDMASFVQNGVTMVPLRLISESMNVSPKWNKKDKTITITTNRTKIWPNKEVDIVLTVDSNIAQVHTRAMKLDATPVIRKNTTFVPLRFIAETLSLEVKWYQESKSIVLTSK